jgi:hypothetical protein
MNWVANDWDWVAARAVAIDTKVILPSHYTKTDIKHLALYLLTELRLKYDGLVRLNFLLDYFVVKGFLTSRKRDNFMLGLLLLFKSLITRKIQQPRNTRNQSSFSCFSCVSWSMF